MSDSTIRSSTSQDDFADLVLGSSLSMQVAESLRSTILSGEIPAGTRVTELGLAERYGVSRTPAREAIRIVADQGLIDLTDRRGAIVREGVSAEDFQYHLEARGAIWGVLAGAAARRARPSEATVLKALVAEVRQAIERDDPSYYDSFLRVYSEIELLSQLPLLAQWTRSGLQLLVSSERLSSVLQDTSSQELDYLEQIVDAIALCQADRASELMTQSYREVMGHPDFRRFFG